MCMIVNLLYKTLNCGIINLNQSCRSITWQFCLMLEIFVVSMFLDLHGCCIILGLSFWLCGEHMLRYWDNSWNWLDKWSFESPRGTYTIRIIFVLPFLRLLLLRDNTFLLFVVHRFIFVRVHPTTYEANENSKYPLPNDNIFQGPTVVHCFLSFAIMSFDV